MKRRNQIILSVVILFCILYYYYNYSYVIFEPMGFNRTFEKKIKPPVDKDFYKRLAFELERGGITYKVDKSGNVLVQRRFSRDVDLMYTFTNRSMDSVWIKQHLESEE